jgi:hypothetical protein
VAQSTLLNMVQPGRQASSEIVQLVRTYLREVVTVQHELLRRLLDDKNDVPLNLAEVFEDAGNRLLDLAEMISERHLRQTKARREAD